jgi:outer membrane protein assembly factor BamB
LRLLPWHPAISHDVIFEGVVALARGEGDGHIYVAGDFTSINGVKRKGVAAVDSASGRLLAWNPPPEDVGVLYTVAVSDDTVFLGGNPSLGTTVLAAVDNETGKETDWTFDWSGADDVSEVRALVVTDHSVYAAGAALTDSGDGVARFDRDDGEALPLGLNTPPFINAMVPNGSNIYVRLMSGRVAVVDAKTGRVRGTVRACSGSEDDRAMAVTESRLIVTCFAAGGKGERLVVLPLGRG